jgi:hypothetical protein
MEDREIDRLQTFFNERECDKVLQMYEKLDSLKHRAVKANKPTGEIMALIGMVADVLSDVTSNHNKIFELTKALDSQQLEAAKARTESYDWRKKYFDARSKIDRSLESDLGVSKSETKLDFNSQL